MPTTNILLSATTKKVIEDVLEAAPQALLVTGPKGVGKTYISRHLAADWLGYDIAKVDVHPNFKSVSSNEGIDSIRGLRAFATLKVVGNDRPVNRVALIEDADGMNTESQNALLKLLEEPPKGMVIILSATSSVLLLPTILSRMTSITISEPDINSVNQYYISKGHSPDLVASVTKVVGPLPGLVSVLLASDEGSDLATAVGFVKQVLSQTIFQRLVEIDALAKNKTTTEATIDMLIRMSEAAMQQLASAQPPGARARLDKWQNVMEQASLAKERLNSSVQAKIVLTDLMLNL